MLNIGAGEIALIAVVALLILGPRRLPELARGIGKFLREFRRQTDEVRSVVEREFYRMDQELEQIASLEPGATPSPPHGGTAVPFGQEPVAGALPGHADEAPRARDHAHGEHGEPLAHGHDAEPTRLDGGPAEATRTEATPFHGHAHAGPEEEHTHPNHPRVDEPSDEPTMAATQTRARGHAETSGSEPVVPQAKSRSG